MLDPVTILTTVAYAVVKRAAADPGSHSGAAFDALSTVIGGAAGNSFHADIGKLRQAFAAAGAPGTGGDLEKAAARSAAHADFFCILQALGDSVERPTSKVETWKRILLDRLPENLRNPGPLGFMAAADRARLLAAKESCEQRLRDIEAGFAAAAIDPHPLFVKPGDDYARKRGAEALEAIEKVHSPLPQPAQAIFHSQWFGYLCGSFRHEIGSNQPVANILSALSTAELFEQGRRTQELVVAEHERTRALIRESVLQPLPKAPSTEDKLRSDAFRKQAEEYLARLRQEFEHVNAGTIYQDAGKATTFPIRKVYVPLRASLEGQQSGEGLPAARMRFGERERGGSPVEESLSHRHLVIRGAAGSGKSTFVRCAVFELSSAGSGETPLKIAERRFPLYVRIADLAAHIHRNLDPQAAAKGSPTRADDASWIARFLPTLNWGGSRKFFELRLKCEDTVLFLDGLDEAPGEDSRAAMARLLVEASRTYSRCHIVVTTRPTAFRGEARPAGFDVVDIQEFNDEEIRLFVSKWCECEYGEGTKQEAESGRLEKALRMPEIQAARLAHNPLMLAALTVIHFNGGEMPRSRQELYESILRWLAKARSHLPGLEKWERRLERLRRLALAMQCWKGGTAVTLPEGDAADLLRSNLPRHFADTKAALDYLALEEDGGILVKQDRKVQFAHLTFQEFQAAKALAPMDKSDIEREIWTDGRLYSPEWRETMRFLPGVLYGQWEEKTEWLFDSILEKTASGVAERARTVALLTVLRDELRRTDLNGDGSVTVTEFHVDSRLRDFTRDMIALFRDPGAGEGLDARTRAEAAEAWERLPDLPGPLLPSDPDYWVDVGPFGIGKYPVTVGEYERFVKAHPKRREPWGWQEQLKWPHRPAVGMTWHDAVNYCEWACVGLPKSSKWRRTRLPKSAEWELAAAGSAPPRVYPWGSEDPDDQRANFGMRAGRVTPVGLFPKGNTPAGVADMAGNVWEWTDSDHEDHPGWKVLRGGSWGGSASFVRASSRSRYAPADRYYSIGFRCVGE